MIIGCIFSGNEQLLLLLNQRAAKQVCPIQYELLFQEDHPQLSMQGWDHIPRTV